MPSDRDLRSRLAGVRALVLDLDGVLVLRGELLPGAAQSLARLEEAGVPYAIGTNMSIVSRATLCRQIRRGGLDVPVERVMTAASAAAAYLRRHFDRQPLYVLAAPDAMTEFAGLRLLSHEEAADPDARVAAVVVGDAGDDFTARNIQSAFTLLRAGARFVAMHKNRWWITPEGILIDSGAYVAALEYGTQRRALVTGKPARAFFAEGVRLVSQLAGRDIPAHQVAMVGDDLWNDIRGAQKAGLVGVFVRSGKHGETELARAAGERGGRAPDAIALSIVDVAEAIAGPRSR
jgi:HAD superfamily hydrolase (TIGR01458 family)